MKKLIFIMSVAVSLLASDQLLAQCNDKLLDICYPNIDDYKYIKSYPIRIRKSKNGEPPIIVRYAVVLNGGVRYKFVCCSANFFDEKIVISLYDGNILLGSTKNYNSDNENPEMEFDCRKSGVYYLSFYFRDGKEGCAVCILAQK